MAEFSKTSPRFLIGTDWLDAADKAPVVDPFTGAVIAQMPQANAAVLDRAISVAHETFTRTRTQTAFERAAILHRVAAAIEQRKAEFADLIVAEAGKPVSLAQGEVARAVATFTAAAEESRHTAGELLDMDSFASGKGHIGMARRFPVGVIYGITPFNFPLNLVAHKVAPCIATGNTMLLKPAPRTPLTALLLAEVLLEAGMTPGQINVVPCPNELAPRPIQDPRVRMVSFTGSPAVGWPIKGQAVRQKVTLELGGNAAVIIAEDADLAAVVPRIAAGAFAYAGQSCISVQRVYVHESILERFRELLLAHVKEKVKTGDPRDPAVINGPMIDPAALQRVLQWITSSGGTLLCGGTTVGPCLNPTVVHSPDPKSDLVCSEAFGPVMTLHSYEDFAQVLDEVNNTRFGLQAGLFTQTLRKAYQAYSQLEVGALLINQVPTFRVETMPYGGVKDSGFGREGVRYAMDEMTEPRGLIVNLESL